MEDLAYSEKLAEIFDPSLFQLLHVDLGFLTVEVLPLHKGLYPYFQGSQQAHMKNTRSVG